MKKKIALFLAVVMTVATPLTAFALDRSDIIYGGSSDSITRQGNSSELANVPAKTLMPQASIFNGGLQAVNNSGSIVKDQDIDYIAQGTDLAIRLKKGDVIKNGDTFRVDLENAHFWFSEDVATDYNRYISINNKKTTFDKDGTAVFGKTNGYTSGTQPTANKYAVNAASASNIPYTMAAQSNNNVKIYNELQYAQVYEKIAVGDSLLADNDPATDNTSVGARANSLIAINKGSGVAGNFVAVGTEKEAFIGYRIAISNNAATGSATATITMIVNVDGAGSDINSDFGYGLLATDPNESTELRIPLPLLTTSEKNARAFVYANGVPALGSSDVNAKEFKLTTGKAGTGTELTISNVNTSRERTELGLITVGESNPGVIKSGIFELSLNDGFVFDNNTLSIIPSSLNWVKQEDAKFLGYNADRTSAYFDITVLNPSVSTRGWFNITGASISRSRDYYNYTEETATLTVRGLAERERITFYDSTGAKTTRDSAGNAGITTKTITVANFVNYGLRFGFENTTDKAVKAYAGRKDVVTPRLQLKEMAADSWWSDRSTRFTLTDADGNPLEGVKIAKVVVSGFENVTYDRASQSFSEDSEIGYDPNYVFNRGYLEIKDLRTQSDYKNAKMNIQFVINTAANFTGDVYVNVGGLAIDPEVDLAPVKIAEIQAPVIIDTKTTDVTIGYQTYRVADVTITEAAKGVLRSGKVFALELDEFANTGNTMYGDISFNPITSGDVTMDTASTLSFSKIALGGNTISFAVNKPSTNDKNPGKFTVSNLNAKINRSVPYGSYDLIAGGTAIAETYDKNATDKTATFPIKGVVYENYIKVATQGDAKSIAKNVQITPGSADALVDGKPQTVEPVPYINEVGRVMLPIRAISKLFDISENNIIWDPQTGTATIVLYSTNNERIITFTNGSTTMTINNVPVSMVDENGVATKAEITPETGRMFVPLRQLGIAFGINVDWDGTTVTLNPIKQNNVEALQTETTNTTVPVTNSTNR